LKKNKKIDINTDLNNIMPFFIKNYPILYKMIIESEDLSILNNMILNIEDICNNKKNIEIK
jgi:hypothetical protein